MYDSPVWSGDGSVVSPVLFSPVAGVFSSAGESSSEAGPLTQPAAATAVAVPIPVNSLRLEGFFTFYLLWYTLMNLWGVRVYEGFSLGLHCYRRGVGRGDTR